MDPKDENAIEVVQEFEITDSEDDDGSDIDYKSVGEEDLSDDDDSEDFTTARRTLEAAASSSSPKRSKGPETGGEGRGEGAGDTEVVTEVKPSAIDDFIRNFLLKMGMMQSLDTFNTEWYELQAKKMTTGQDDGTGFDEVPDVYLQNQRLEMELKLMAEEVSKYKSIADKAQGTWNKFRKERNFHRTNHQRVVQEKKRLVVDMKRLKKHYEGFEPALQQLQGKFQAALKEKMLMSLERNRLRASTKSLNATIQTLSASKDGGATAASAASATQGKKSTSKANAAARKSANNTKNKKTKNLTTLRVVQNPFEGLEFDKPQVENFALSKTFKGHQSAIAGLAFHPKKPILATVSDDQTWKLWSSPNGELIMSGEGHEDWIGDVAFHPTGTRLVTCSGDSTIKVWDFINAKCAATLREHTQAVWAIDFHHSGDFMASCSMDQTAKLWDVHRNTCVQTFRAHVDCVNFTQFQPFSNTLCTVSGDKTISLWDARSGLIQSTLYGHNNAVNCARFNVHGDTLVSCDADGVVKLWDHRMVSELGTVDLGLHSANEVCFDRSGSLLAVASDDGTVKCVDASAREAPKLVHTLSTGDEGVSPVCAVLFDPQSRYLVSGGSDAAFRIWL